jgi:aspartyl protease family protein
MWLLLVVLGGALLLLVWRHEDGTVAGLDNDDFASLVVRASLVVFIGASVVMLFRERLFEAFQAAMFWVVVAMLLAVGYTYRFDLRDMGERVMAEFLPGRAASRGTAVEIARARGGEFQIGAQVNDARLAMVLDTGASAVVLTQEAAKAAGLPIEVLSYDVTVETANGRTRAASVTLDRLAVGSIVERAVPALIAQPGQLKTNLLGMSFLNRLQSWEVRGDKLVMRGKP